MRDGMTLLRETCAAYGLEDVADDLWAWFSDPKSPTFNAVEATIQRLRTHPSYTAPSPWELLWAWEHSTSGAPTAQRATH